MRSKRPEPGSWRGGQGPGSRMSSVDIQGGAGWRATCDGTGGEPGAPRWLPVPSLAGRAYLQIVHRAWVGDMRAARRAGHSPATAPINMAAPMPPPQAVAGMTMSSCLVEA
jgi:hypothetical protein